MFAVDAPAVTPRTAAAIAESAQLSVTDIGTCLRAVGQNPTQADIARITAILPPPPQPEIGDGIPSAAASNAPASISSNRALFPAATKKQSAAGAGRLLTGASDIGANSRLSVDETLSTEVTDQCAASDFLSNLTNNVTEIANGWHVLVVFGVVNLIKCPD